VHLRETLRRDVVTAVVDTGGFDAAELERIAARSRELGAAQHVTVDGTKAVFDRFVTHLVAGNCLRGGTYPLSVSAERIVQAEEIARVAREVGASAVAHGSTGAGNDQIRFDVAFSVLLPSVQVLAPVRELALSRQEEFDFLASRGFATKLEAKTYSVNRGLWGTTIGGGGLHDPKRPVPSDCWQDTAEPDSAPTGGETIAIRFEKGVPTGLEGRSQTGPALVRELNSRGARHGVGRGIHTGDTILGIKGRLAFEAPAAAILIFAHRELEKLVLSKHQMTWKDRLGAFYGDLVHEGLYFDPVTRDVESFLSSSQRAVDGTVTVRAARGRIEVVSIDAPGSLLGRLGAVYGEGSRAWTGEEARAFTKLYGLPQVVAARRDASARTGEA
jgi:argininosuccinate synthase